MSANGYLTLDELAPATGGVANPSYPGTGQLANPVAAAWNAMAVHIHAETGQWIRSNGSDSMYRPYPRQVYWRNYWCGQGACQNAAVPGTSNHGLGWAIDVPEDTHALIRTYGAPFGFRDACSDAPWEGWHVKWCGGWTGPDPGPYGSGGGGHPISYPTLRHGDHGPAVRRAQRMLKRWNLGITRPNPDGGFGDVTRRAVAEFQITHGLHRDGVIGAKTWRELRRKDVFLTDSRTHLNRLRLLRCRDEGAHQRHQINKHRRWCANRAKQIAATAQVHGWKDQHRALRHRVLQKAGGLLRHNDTRLEFPPVPGNPDGAFLLSLPDDIDREDV